MRVPLGAALLERWLNPATARQEPGFCFFSWSPLQGMWPSMNILTMPMIHTMWWKQVVFESVSVLLHNLDCSSNRWILSFQTVTHSRQSLALGYYQTFQNHWLEIKYWNLLERNNNNVVFLSYVVPKIF